MATAAALAVATVYFTAAAALMLYGINCYVLVVFYLRRRALAAAQRASIRALSTDLSGAADAPLVVTQIPIYNEMNVVARAVEAACRMRYAPGRHTVQVLDDSTDDTRVLLDDTVARMRSQGHDVTVVRRSGREGFKAGALAHGMSVAYGDLFAIFDADFVPPPDFLLRTIPFFVNRPRVGLVQCRWGHLNRDRSLLTRAQAMGIDGHFMVEQSARAWNGLVLNFNGTAGIWRREAIESAGGWQGDTLTEDLDLSYRARLAGWDATYLPDVVVPAEIPEDVNAFKSQQFRWAKGSIQTAIKLSPRILRSNLSRFAKLQAMLHLTHYAVHPLMLTLALLSLPVVLVMREALSPAAYATLGTLLIAAMLAPNTMYVVSQRSAYADWPRRVAYLPVLSVIGVGTAVSNTRAVIEAIAGRPSEFVRTPKRGELAATEYRVGPTAMAAAEIALGAYCVAALGYHLATADYLIGPFLALYSIGFSSVGALSVFHSRQSGARPQATG